RGQGLSDRGPADIRKGHIEDFSEYDNDLATFMQQVVLPDCPPPVFAMRHWMVAPVLIRAAFQGPRWFDRVVLSTPMIALPGMRGSGGARATAQLMRALRLKTSYVPGGDSS